MIKYMLTSAAMIALFSSATFAQGDPEKGERVFKMCQACHQVGEGAKSRPTGPNLTGVVGRTAGTVEDFDYSKAMTAAGEEGLVWTHEILVEYLKNPRDLVPGTKMVFRVAKESDIENVIAYLETFSGDEE